MTASMRNQRARLYQGSTAATFGVPNDTFAFAAEYWCRRTFTSGLSVYMGLKLERQADAVIEFASDVPVPSPAVVVIESEQYRVLEVLARGGASGSAQVVLCTRVQGGDVTLTGD